LYNHYPISFWRWIVCIKNLKINPAQGGVFRFYGKEVKNMKTEFSPKETVDIIMPFVTIGGINNRDLFERAILKNHSRGLPIQIAGFIGQGGKDHLGKSDIDLLRRYSQVQNELRKNYPFDVEVSLIGADIHGLSNSMPDNGYLNLIQNEAILKGFNWTLLSKLYQEKRLILRTWTEASKQLYQEKGDEFEEWVRIPNQIRNDLIKQAGRHNKSDVSIGDDESNDVLNAFYYFLMRKAEEKIFVPDWQDFLFIINGSRELAEHTFPQSIAQMYWYDTRHHGGHGSRELNRDMILPPAWFRND